jgi:hypothetical protein
MNRLKLSGNAPTLRDQQRAVTSRANNYGTVDFETLRSTLKGREFVGPPMPITLRADFQPDQKAERSSRLYWQMVADMRRFGHCEFSETGTPFVGDAFGFGQSIEVHV